MLEIQHLHKIYKPENVHALNDVSISIEEGEFVGLLGPNGAGKTTLINTLAGHVIKTSGSVIIDGNDLDNNELDTKKILGIVPQEVSFDSFFTVNEMLNNQSGYFGIRNNQAYIDELLVELSLKDKKYTNTRQLSGGMKRRLLIVKALVHKPKIVVLDEPTAGVDVELRQSLYTFLRKMHAQGLTIILTTHYLEEAETLCDRIIIINTGTVIIDGNKDDLVEKLGGNTVLEFTFNEPINDKDYQYLAAHTPHIHGKKLHITAYKKDLKEIFTLLSQHDANYISFRMDDDNLEDIFMQLVNGNQSHK